MEGSGYTFCLYCIHLYFALVLFGIVIVWHRLRFIFASFLPWSCLLEDVVFLWRANIFWRNCLVFWRRGVYINFLILDLFVVCLIYLFIVLHSHLRCLLDALVWAVFFFYEGGSYFHQRGVSLIFALSLYCMDVDCARYC